MRHRQIIIAFRALLIILLSGLFYIQIIRGEYFYNLSKRNIIRVVALDAARGRILDRNGVIIADSVPSFNLSLIPQEVEDKTKLIFRISKLLNIPSEKLVQNYKKNYFNPFIPVKIYENINKDQIIALEENKLKLRGIVIDVLPQRIYPFRNAASHVLGYLGQIDLSRITKLKPYGYEISDLMGYGGIEEHYDLVLRGQKGGEQIEVDNRGERVRVVGYKPPQVGRDIQLTIDVRLQEIINTCMESNKGAIVFMDPYSGEIIALGSYPNYDPNDFINRKEEVIGDLFREGSAPLFNRAISGQYPAGSIFKIVTTVAALEKNFSLIDKNFFCSGKLEIGGRDYKCWSVHENENLRDAVVHSCNVYFYNLGILVGPETINKFAHLFGLGKETDVDLNYEAKGFIPSPNWKKLMRFQSWFTGDTANMAIGQGDILVTPLQLARMIAVFANGGQLVRPHLIKSVENKRVKKIKSKSVKLDNEVLNNMRRYLRGVVDDPEGTGHIAMTEGINIYGKTGTAQVFNSQPHGWFVGYVGREKPKYAFCIFLENGGSGFFSCVVAKKIFSEMLKQGLI